MDTSFDVFFYVISKWAKLAHGSVSTAFQGEVQFSDLPLSIDML